MTMEKVTFIELENRDGSKDTYAIIDHANDTFTSMLKADYDRQQVEHLTEIPTPDEA
jgi:hypothetical protein